MSTRLIAVDRSADASPFVAAVGGLISRGPSHKLQTGALAIIPPLEQDGTLAPVPAVLSLGDAQVP